MDFLSVLILPVGDKMATYHTYHSSDFHLSAPMFISSRIAASNIQCCSLFSCQNDRSAVSPITHLWSVPTLTHVSQTIRSFYFKTVLSSALALCFFFFFYLCSVCILLQGTDREGYNPSVFPACVNEGC